MEQTKPTTRAEEIAGEGPYTIKEHRPEGLFTVEGPTFSSQTFHQYNRAESLRTELNAAYKQGQQDRWIAVRELVIGWRYVVQEAGGYAFVGTYTGGRFEFTVDGNNYVRQVAKSQYITLLPSPPNPEQR